MPQLTQHLESERRLRRPREVVVAGDAPQIAQRVIPVELPVFQQSQAVGRRLGKSVQETYARDPGGIIYDVKGSVQCLFCSKNSTTEGRGGKKGGSTNSINKHTNF